MSRECVMAGSIARERMEQDVGSDVGTIVTPGRSVQLMNAQFIKKPEGTGRCCIVQTGGAEEYFYQIASFVDGYHISLTVNLDAVGAIGYPVGLTALRIKGIGHTSDGYGLAADRCAAVVRIQVVTVVVVENPAGDPRKKEMKKQAAEKAE